MDVKKIKLDSLYEERDYLESEIKRQTKDPYDYCPLVDELEERLKSVYAQIDTHLQDPTNFQ